MIGTAIKSLLSDVTQYVDGGRIPHSRGTRWIIYNMISCVPHPTKDGASTFDKYRFQLDCCARTYEDADTLAASVKSVMANYSGTVSSVVIDRIRFDGEYDSVEFIEEDESREDYFRRIQDYIITVKT